jgi:hypothetical protein
MLTFMSMTLSSLSTIRENFQQNEIMKVDRSRDQPSWFHFVEKFPDPFYANEKFYLLGTGNSLWDARRQEKYIGVEQRFTEIVWD